MDSLTFMSYNSTGLDNFRIKWINDLIKTFRVDFFQLQEHFRAINLKSLDTLFKKFFPLMDNFSISAYRNPGQETGRAKGGLSQLSSKKNLVKKRKNLNKVSKNSSASFTY